MHQADFPNTTKPSRRLFLTAGVATSVAAGTIATAFMVATKLADDVSSRFLELVSEYRALDDELDAYPGDVPLALELDWLGRSRRLEALMAETPITSTEEAIEAMRLVNHRMDGSEATDLDCAILRNVQLFMEG